MKPALLLSFALLLSTCSGTETGFRPNLVPRDQRRSFAGAPPMIPHAPLGANCVSCHTPVGMIIENLGKAPAMPHEETPGLSAGSRCRQCHVFRRTESVWAESTFVGFQRLPAAAPAYPGAPPVMPHPLGMREDCLSCHSGPSAQLDLRTTHPERIRCLQCHTVPPGTSHPTKGG